MKSVKIYNANNPSVLISSHVCDKFIPKLMGLMFRKKIGPYYGLLFVESSESKLNTSIHMFFMFFDITVLWLNKDLIVVDKTVAKKWRPIYAPRHPAQYTLELHVSRYGDYSIGDVLQVSDES